MPHYHPSTCYLIGDGYQNTIGSTITAALCADYGLVGSGQNNCIDTGAAMKTAAPFGVIIYCQSIVQTHL